VLCWDASPVCLSGVTPIQQQLLLHLQSFGLLWFGPCGTGTSDITAVQAFLRGAAAFYRGAASWSSSVFDYGPCVTGPLYHALGKRKVLSSHLSKGSRATGPFLPGWTRRLMPYLAARLGGAAGLGWARLG
jgi:hypothetical protein